MQMMDMLDKFNEDNLFFKCLAFTTVVFRKQWPFDFFYFLDPQAVLGGITGWKNYSL